MAFTQLIFRLFSLCIEPICAAEWEKRPIKKSLPSSDESITAAPSWLAVWHKARRELRRVFWLRFIQPSRSNLATYCSLCRFIVSVLHSMKKNEQIKKTHTCTELHLQVYAQSDMHLKGLFCLCSFYSCLLLLGKGKGKWGRKRDGCLPFCTNNNTWLLYFNFKENIVLPSHLPLISVWTNQPLTVFKQIFSPQQA